mmetsp:Transcript_8434/g.26279  ORF Transcript_8434/g.26279 Transcript_8434/m.26279 type:complete len:237 (+) Transcript_8434:69-779(+)
MCKSPSLLLWSVPSSKIGETSRPSTNLVSQRWPPLPRRCVASFRCTAVSPTLSPTKLLGGMVCLYRSAAHDRPCSCSLRVCARSCPSFQRSGRLPMTPLGPRWYRVSTSVSGPSHGPRQHPWRSTRPSTWRYPRSPRRLKPRRSRRRPGGAPSTTVRCRRGRPRRLATGCPAGRFRTSEPACRPALAATLGLCTSAARLLAVHRTSASRVRPCTASISEGRCRCVAEGSCRSRGPV